MSINYTAVLVASVLQFIAGFVWYGPIFGKLWGTIHGFDKLPKDVQEKMMKSMGPWYGVQFLLTVLTTFVLALLAGGLPTEWNLYGLAGFSWLGFVVTTQASALIFGGVDPKWLWHKFGVMAGGSLVCLMIAAATLQYMK